MTTTSRLGFAFLLLVAPGAVGDSTKELIEKRIVGNWTFRRPNKNNFTWAFSKAGEYHYKRPDGRLTLHSVGAYRINEAGNVVILSERVTEPGSTNGEQFGKMFGLGEQFIEWLDEKSFRLIMAGENGKPMKGPDGKLIGAGPFTKDP